VEKLANGQGCKWEWMLIEGMYQVPDLSKEVFPIYKAVINKMCSTKPPYS
jgi:hypothetical protein